MSIRNLSRFKASLCSVLLVACAGAIPGCSNASSNLKKNPDAKPSAGSVPAVGPDDVQIVMRNVVYRVLPNVGLNVQVLDGWMLQARSGQIISLDDPNSFTLDIGAAHVSISAPDLSALVNSYILPRSGAPIRDLTMKLNPDQTVSVTGTFHKLVDLNFQSQATLQVTPDGNMQMHFFDMRVGRVLHQSLLDFLGMKVAQFAQPKNPQAFRVVGNDMIFPIAEMFPPPRVSSKLQSLSIVQGRLHFIFRAGFTPSLDAPPGAEHDYVFFHGGSMRFGKLTMKPVEMELVSLKPARTFEFSLAGYTQQLVAGYSKSLPNGGLIVHMGNYVDIQAKPNKH